MAVQHFKKKSAATKKMGKGAQTLVARKQHAFYNMYTKQVPYGALLVLVGGFSNGDLNILYI